MTDSLEPLGVSPTGAARYLGVSKRQIYVLLAAGSIRARKRGNSTIVDVPSLKSYYETLPEFEAGNRLFSS